LDYLNKVCTTRSASADQIAAKARHEYYNEVYINCVGKRTLFIPSVKIRPTYFGLLNLFSSSSSRRHIATYGRIHNVAL